jgi:hypothetical protein
MTAGAGAKGPMSSLLRDGWRLEVPFAADDSCAAIAAQIAALNNQIGQLQQQLRHAASNEKPAIIEEIIADDRKLARLEAEQRDCPVAYRLLEADIPVQQQSNWCWVAVGSGIASFYDSTTYSQCAVVTEVFSTIHPPFNLNCCDPTSDPSELPCNGESGADQALDHPRHHFAGNVAGALDWATLVAQIDQGRPVAAEISWRSGDAHFVAITGYSETAASPSQYMVYVQDPARGFKAWLTLDQLTNNYDNAGSWTSTTLSQQ